MVLPTLRSLAAVLALIMLAAVAPAQSAAQTPADEPATESGEVEIQAESFGLGDVIRGGDYAGVRLALRDHSDRVRAVIVRLHVRDPDGDTAYYQRAITLNPGKAQGVWLYPRFPFGVRSGDIYTVTVHAAVGEDSGQALLQAGRQIGAARVQVRNVLQEGEGLMGVVGRQGLGLDLYAAKPVGREQPGTAHEAIERIADLTPATMPDSWRGISSLESLIWVEGDPGELTEDGAEAIREWVNRGGQLVIVLPPVGQAWTNPRSNPLLDMMPAATIERHEDVDLAPYRRMLTRSDTVELPDRAVLHTFVALPDVKPGEATPVLSGPDRACVVMRRLVGTGMVTLVGFDLASTRLASRVDPQAFWHRILGKRADALSPTEMDDRTRLGVNNRVDFIARSVVWLDGDIGSQINLTGEAGKGVLLALFLFAAYLVLAGPGGFTLLKRRNLKQHAWVAFVGVAALFTLIAWGGAAALRPKSVQMQHLTFIDHVYDQPYERARTWFSVLLPRYGEATVSIGPPGKAGEAAQAIGRNALAAWEAPDASARKSFPDTRGYVVDTRHADSLTLPARSTVKQLQADWLGGPVWKMPTPDSPIGLDENGGLHGVLTHGLPSTLEEVEVVLVQKQRPYGPTTLGGNMLAVTLASKPGSWPPGVPLDLSTVTRGNAVQMGDLYFKHLAESNNKFLGLSNETDTKSAPARLSMLAWHSMLEPPNWRTFGGETKVLLQRRATEGWDLGKWFTQPCLIIVGQLVDTAAPTPIYVDGKQVPSSGRTIVRWVYPLTPNPPSPQPE